MPKVSVVHVCFDAFVRKTPRQGHDLEEQANSTEADIPFRIEDLIKHMEENEPYKDEGVHGADKPKD